MTPHAFTITCKAIFPYGWQSKIGPLIGYSRSQIINFAEGIHPVPEEVVTKLDAILKERIKDMEKHLDRRKEERT